MVTFVIAWLGVLLGELDTIARVVSMFFIATYGFLNLACAIESWASPDFRPALRVRRWVSVLGAVACLVVMIQLDVLAMIGATVILGALYFYLARKQLQLESGDAWRGFWSSVARAALHRLDRRPGHRRNWRPVGVEPADNSWSEDSSMCSTAAQPDDRRFGWVRQSRRWPLPNASWPSYLRLYYLLW